MMRRGESENIVESSGCSSSRLILAPSVECRFWDLREPEGVEQSAAGDKKAFEMFCVERIGRRG